MVRRTILSAALLEYPDRRVVLLIDDPPLPDSGTAANDLAAMRELSDEVSSMLDPIAEKFGVSSREYRMRGINGFLDVGAEHARLSRL